MVLGNCYLHLRHFEQAIKASQACLNRFPDMIHAQFNIGQSLYHLMLDGSAPPDALEQASTLLEKAKRLSPNRWWKTHELMLAYCLAEPEHRQEVPRQDVNVWTTSVFFRP